MNIDPATIFDEFLADPNHDAVALNDVPASVYHADNRFVSKHMLDIFADSPEKYAYALTHPDEKDSPALRFGEALHSYTLTNGEFFQAYVTAPPTIKVRRGKEWEAFLEKNRGKEVLTAEEYSKIQGMDVALGNHDKARELIYEADGENEVTVLFNMILPRGRVRPCKARLDRVIESQHLIVDLKTCVSASPQAFQRAVWNFRYHVQASFYQHAIQSIYGDGEEWRFAIVAIEKEPPYAVAVYYLDDWMQAGYEAWGRDIQLLADAEESGIYAGYHIKNDKLPMPVWAKKEAGVYDE